MKATDPYGRRWVIQRKHRRNGLAGSAVGTPDLQVLNGTARQVHGADIAVIITNGRVTAPAVTFARQQRLHVVDRHILAAWASGSRPLWELLLAVPPPPQADRPLLKRVRDEHRFAARYPQTRYRIPYPDRCLSVPDRLARFHDSAIRLTVLGR